MASYAAIDSSNVVLGVFTWDGVTTWNGPPGTSIKELLLSGEACGPGYTFNALGSPRFTAPTPVVYAQIAYNDAEYVIATARTDTPNGRVPTASTSITVDKTKAGEIEFRRAALTGDVTASANSNATTIANDAVTFAKMQNIATDRLLGRDTASTGDVEELTVGNGLEFTGSGGIGVANDGITYARIQNVSAASRLLGRGSASGSGDVEEISLGTGLSMSGTTLSATATGGGTKTYAVFTPLTNTPPASNFATLDTRNSIPVLEFDGGSTDEYAIWVGVMPEAAVLTSGLEVRITWMADTATSGDVRWGVQFERGNTNLGSDSWDTAAEGNSAANGTSGIPSVASITNTNVDGITAGDLFRLRVYREASDTTNDTMTGDAQLIAVEVRGV